MVSPEVLLDQGHFIGVGNYLRAKALHRCRIRPFDSTVDVLAPMLFSQGGSVEKPDLLYMMHNLALEVYELLGPGNNYDIGGGSKKEEFTVPILEWCQCYRQRAAKRVRDKNKRSVWYKGELGSCALVEKRKGWTVSVELNENNTDHRMTRNETARRRSPRNTGV